ncbi:MAG: class I SAM-dependent methyltransferase [Saprospiraceae bacterium]|nr:class I SAM-dependent methyltransferase [Saprospiraceae bacterium]
MLFAQRLLYWLRRLRYPGSQRYWERRYARGGHSGAGSSGRLAQYKADWLNQFVRTQGVRSVLELGCGDGQQLLLAEYPAYRGFDIAPSALERCRRLFAADPSKQFDHYAPAHFDPTAVQADLALSLEVIFHLTEDELYQAHLRHLFGSARRWVVIFSADEAGESPFPHFRLRRFSADVPLGWRLRARVPNPHRDISVSDFYLFEKISPGT